MKDDVCAFRAFDGFHSDILEAAEFPERAHVFGNGRAVVRAAHLCGKVHAADGAGQGN
jgi:hypothetical protein